MSRTTYIVGFSLMILLLMVASTMLLTSRSPDDSALHFAEHLNKRLVLPSHESDIARQTTKYASDNVTKISDAVEFKDGSTGYVNYRVNGKFATYGVFYPQVENQPLQIKVEGEYTADGASLKWQKQYRLDGSLESTGIRLASGDYVVRNFETDGIQLASTQIFDKDKVAYDSFTLHPNNEVATLVRVTQSGNKTETTFFSDKGVRQRYESVNYSNVVWLTYQEDGKTPAYSFEQKSEAVPGQSSYYILAVYYNKDGSIDHERKIGRHTMFVTVKGEDGEILYVQYWNNKAPDTDDMSMEADAWVLETVYVGELYDFQKPRFYFHKDGTSIKRHTYSVNLHNGDTGYVEMWYHQEDGSVMNTQIPDNDTGEKVETTYKPGEFVEPFDRSLMQDMHKPIAYVVPPVLPAKTEYHKEGGP